ncbi:hypothetical protein C8Q70DRAFT_918034, partial [Cubamyces menziesii]
GNHSEVYRAPLVLRLDEGSQALRRVSVAAKIACQECGAHEMLRREAKMYNEFPRAFQEDTLPAIVPKFFGYYAPVNEDGTPFLEEHLSCGLSAWCHVPWPSHILLVEECGEPIRADPSVMSLHEREKCHELFKRLHAGGFVQKSPFERNILVQPGPLSAPRAERTMDRPSYRIIDFGRGEALALLDPDQDYPECFKDWVRRENDEVVYELELHH